MRPKIVLFSTEGCHLCDEALKMLEFIAQNDSNALTLSDVSFIDIAESERLVEKYGIRIPVVASDEKELGWPFTIEELYHWIQSIKN